MFGPQCAVLPIKPRHQSPNRLHLQRQTLQQFRFGMPRQPLVDSADLIFDRLAVKAAFSGNHFPRKSFGDEVIPHTILKSSHILRTGLDEP